MTYGRTLSDTQMLNLAVVHACRRVLSESVSQVPFHAYKREGRNRTQISEADDWRVGRLTRKANPQMTASKFKMRVMAHLTGWGNAFIWKQLTPDGRYWLWPLHPRRVHLVLAPDGSTRAYQVDTYNGGSEILLAEEVIHIAAFGDDDLGISPLGVARQDAGILVSGLEYAARAMENDGRPGGVLKYNKSLNDEQYAEAVRRWAAGHTGLKNSNLVAILTKDEEWKDVARIPNGDLAYLDTRKFQKREIASAYRVPLHMLNDLESGASYASVEQMSLDYVVHVLTPYLNLIEESLQDGLFGSDKDIAAGYYVKATANALMRATMLDRYKAYWYGRMWGWLSANDIRVLEDMDLIPAEQGGDDYIVPLNYTIGGMAPEPDANNEEDNIRSLMQPLMNGNGNGHRELGSGAEQGIEDLVRAMVGEARKLRGRPALEMPAVPPEVAVA